MSSGTAVRSSVHCVTQDDVAFVTLCAPPLNILTAEMMLELAASVETAQHEPAIKAIVLQAEGRAFSAGADVGEHRPDKAPEMISAFSHLFSVLGASELPIVAVVDGAALGAGFELAMMADILLASTNATFGQPEIRIGFFAPVAVAWLARRVGAGRAIEITARGRVYTAEEMSGFGLVSRVVSREALPTALEEVLSDLRRASGAVMRMNVRLTREFLGRPFEEARREAERVFLHDLMQTDDVHEGIASFFEKRSPVWSNR